MIRATQIDANQTEIIASLREHGATVQSLRAIGKGCPDLLVGFRGQNFLMEIKDRSSSKKLTSDKQEWNGTINIVHDIQGALWVIGILST